MAKHRSYCGAAEAPTPDGKVVTWNCCCDFAAPQTPDPDLAARCIQTGILVGFGARRHWAIRVARRLPEFTRWLRAGLLDAIEHEVK